MKTIAQTQPMLPVKTAGLNIDIQATLMRRVVPLSLALGAWALVIGAVRLIF
jgi:hypothetical protein